MVKNVPGRRYRKWCETINGLYGKRKEDRLLLDEQEVSGRSEQRGDSSEGDERVRVCQGTIGDGIEKQPSFLPPSFLFVYLRHSRCTHF